MLRNFDTPLDQPGVSRLVVTKSASEVRVVSSVTVAQQPSAARAFLVKDQTSWTWEDLRDYVVAQIEQRFGPFPRVATKEAAIFKSFLTRYGDKAPSIARYAFEVKDGVWAGAPISVNRFCKNSDPYFADKIVERVVDSPVQGW